MAVLDLRKQQLLMCSIDVNKSSLAIRSFDELKDKTNIHLAGSYCKCGVLSLLTRVASHAAPSWCQRTSPRLVGRALTAQASAAVAAQDQTGFHGHPAMVDASLHLGAALAAAERPDRMGLLVPVGCELFHGPAAQQPGGCRYAAAGVDGLASSNHRLADLLGTTAIAVAGLQTKALPQHAREGLTAPAMQPGQVTASWKAAIYTLQWQTDHSENAVQFRAPRASGTSWYLKHRGSSAVCLDAANSVLACCTALSLLQPALSDAASVIGLVTQGMHGGQPPGRLNTTTQRHHNASLSALLRVAAAEHPAAKFSCSDTDPATAGSSRLQHAHRDPFGSAAIAQAVLLPRLLPALQGSASELPPMAGRVVVTGGLTGTPKTRLFLSC